MDYGLPKIDVLTVLISSLLVSFGFFIGLILRWLFFLRKRELLYWSLSQLCYCIGLLLFAGRGFLPAVVSTVVGNGFILAGYCLIWSGASLYRAKTPSFRIMTAAVTAFFVGHIYYGFVEENIALRIIIYDLTAGILASGIALTFLRPGKDGRRRMDFVAAAPMVLDVLIKAGAIAFQLTRLQHREPFLSNLTIGITLLGALVVQVSWGISTFLLIFESVVGKLRRTESEAVEAKNLLESVLNAIPTRVFWKDRDLKYRGANTHFLRDSGIKDLGDLLGKTDFDLPWRAAARELRSNDRNVIETGKPILDFEQTIPDPTSSSEFHTLTSKVPLRNSGNEIIGVVGAYTDITKQKEARKEISRLLSEKEMLLKEVHHRIKNDMSIVSSLLSLHAGRLGDSEAGQALTEAKNKIHGMLILYDKLYRSADFKNVSVREYLGSLVAEIASVFPNSGAVGLRVDVEDIQLDTKALFPLGIMLNEIITNSFKYAFPPPTPEEAEIAVTVVRNPEGKIEVAVRDNGTGFRKDAGGPGFGLNLVEELAKQLKASMEADTESGTSYRFVFPA